MGARSSLFDHIYCHEGRQGDDADGRPRCNNTCTFSVLLREFHVTCPASSAIATLGAFMNSMASTVIAPSSDNPWCRPFGTSGSFLRSSCASRSTSAPCRDVISVLEKSLELRELSNSMLLALRSRSASPIFALASGACAGRPSPAIGWAPESVVGLISSMSPDLAGHYL